MSSAATRELMPEAATARRATSHGRCACGRPIVAVGECSECRARRLSGAVQTGLSGPGRGLGPPVRRRMETAFGRDFSGVRVHSDDGAAASAQALGARAWTLGSDIVLDAGAPRPSSRAGDTLLAHELAHVAQQPHRAASGPRVGSRADAAEAQATRAGAAGTAGAPAVGLSPQPEGVVWREPQPGTSVYEEHVDVGATDPGQPGITSGTVRREEHFSATQSTRSLSANVRFDANACRVIIPVKVAYQEPNAGDIAEWQGVNPASTVSKTQPGLPAGKGRDVFDRYVKTANTWLNNWFNLRLDGCAGAPCADRAIPIQVEVTEQSGHPDYTVVAISATGRSFVSSSRQRVLLEAGANTETLAHESGHMALAHGDEYREAGRPIERVRTDRTLMGTQPGIWSELHERHFKFVPEFMSKILPGGASCRPRLEQLRHATGDIRFEATESWFAGTRTSGIALGAGIDVGSASASSRYGVGPHATLAPSNPTQRSAYLLGVRVSAEHRFHAGDDVNLPVGVSAEAGYGVHGGGPYVEGGVRAGLDFRLGTSTVGKLFVEAAAGTNIDPHDPENQRWFRAGVGLGLGF